MECKNCGANIPDDSLVCEVCGASVLEEMSDFNDETKAINRDEILAASESFAQAQTDTDNNVFDENEKKRDEQIRKMQEDKKKQLGEIERRRNEKRKRQRRRKAAIIALICAIVISGAGIGAYYIAKGANGVATKPTATPTPAASVSPSPMASVSPMPSISPMPSGIAASPSPTDGQSWTSASNTSSAAQSGNAGQTTQGLTSSGTSTVTRPSSSSTSNTQSGSTPSKSGGSTAQSGSSSSASNPSNTVSDSGLVSEAISSRSVTGGEVLYNEGTGRYLMTFTMDGKRYYANVSEGSTTEQIKNKSFTIDADATQESYGGNTVYEISSMINTTGSYVLEKSSEKLLTSSDIQGMSKYDLALARNEIFARHGRKFQTPEYSRYFSAKSWYKINPNYNYSDDNANLNEIEKKNVQFILTVEKSK